MKLPVVGSLFRKTTNDKIRTELVILIRPEVTTGPTADTKIREREMEFLNVEPDLESSVYPPNLRQRAAAPGMVRRSAIDLRPDDRAGQVDRVGQ
jgi:type II secretory pathway component GspD/PulD (secretin)